MLLYLQIIFFVTFIEMSYTVSPADIMIDSDDGVESKEVNNVMDKEDSKFQNNNICHMEVQFTRRIMGYCIKHGLAAHSCMADGYLHPYHRDCLAI